MNIQKQPTIFHITHPKAGSQWVMQVLHECAPERFIQPLPQRKHFKKEPIHPGMFYPAVYVNRKEFYTVISPWRGHQYLTCLSPLSILKYYQNWFQFGFHHQPYKTFIVIRDLRDTLVSLYFSLKYSHPILNAKTSNHRTHLMEMPFDESLLYLMNDELWKFSRIQTSWLKERTLLVKYEELIADEIATFQKITEHCEINVSKDHLQNVIQRNNFQTRSGRPMGTEDINSHHRKGIAGDWKNHFSPLMIDEFKARFGKTLIQTGYETDLNW